VMGVNLETLRPEPTVEGYSVPGGYSCRAVRPVALRMVMELATMMFGRGGPPAAVPEPGAPQGAFPDRSLSAIGGVESGEDAAQFLLLGASTVQVCTGVMIHGYQLVHELEKGLRRFMERHGFGGIEEFKGRSLPYFTTHADLVARQAAARRENRARADGSRDDVVRRDADWSGDRFVEQSARLAGRGDLA